MPLDLLVWQEFLEQFNGKSFFVDDIFLTGDYLQLFTNAMGRGASDMELFVGPNGFLINGPCPD